MSSIEARCSAVSTAHSAVLGGRLSAPGIRRPPTSACWAKLAEAHLRKNLEPRQRAWRLGDGIGSAAMWLGDGIRSAAMPHGGRGRGQRTSKDTGGTPEDSCERHI